MIVEDLSSRGAENQTDISFQLNKIGKLTFQFGCQFIDLYDMLKLNQTNKPK